MPRSLKLALAAVAMTASGCDIGDDATVGGELGRGRFEYICVNDTDPACSGFLDASTFPDVFAVGGRFWTRFEPEDGGQVPEIKTSAPEVLSLDRTMLTFERAGTVAVLAVRQTDLVDYKHLDAAPIASVTFERDAEQAVGSLLLTEREEARVDATPNDAQGRELGGALDYTWRIVDPTIAELVSPDNVDDITVRGLAVGQTTLEMTAGDFSTSLLITVEAGTTSTSTTTDGTGTDGTSDTDGSGTDSGSTGGTAG
jgi:hypothetical protein